MANKLCCCCCCSWTPLAWLGFWTVWPLPGPPLDVRKGMKPIKQQQQCPSSSCNASFISLMCIVAKLWYIRDRVRSSNPSTIKKTFQLLPVKKLLSWNRIRQLIAWKQMLWWGKGWALLPTTVHLLKSRKWRKRRLSRRSFNCRKDRRNWARFFTNDVDVCNAWLPSLHHRHMGAHGNFYEGKIQPSLSSPSLPFFLSPLLFSPFLFLLPSPHSRRLVTFA